MRRPIMIFYKTLFETTAALSVMHHGRIAGYREGDIHLVATENEWGSDLKRWRAPRLQSSRHFDTMDLKLIRFEGRSKLAS